MSSSSGRCCSGDHHHHEISQEMGVEYSLYSKINLENLECLNEAVPNSGKSVFKSWENRLDLQSYVESDTDEELLFNIPFTGNVKLKGIIVIGEDANNHPSKVRLYKNRDFMTFDDVTMPADQEFDLHIDTQGVLEYPTKIVTFNNVQHLTLHFPSNFGDPTTKIYYIGLRGEWTEAPHQGIVIANYELRPQIDDHKNPLDIDGAPPQVQ